MKYNERLYQQIDLLHYIIYAKHTYTSYKGPIVTVI